MDHTEEKTAADHSLNTSGHTAVDFHLFFFKGRTPYITHRGVAKR